MKPPLLHHIAIGTSKLQQMREFYLKLPCMELTREWYDEMGSLRSVWFHISPNVILMIEKKEKTKAPEALVFSLDSQSYVQIKNFQIIEQTKSSIYFLDPDGNKIGYSISKGNFFFRSPLSFSWVSFSLSFSLAI